MIIRTRFYFTLLGCVVLASFVSSCSDRYRNPAYDPRNQETPQTTIAG